MSHQTGLILMEMLAKAKRSLSFEEILDKIEKTVGKPVEQPLIEAVMDTLENGVKLGFLHRNGANYCIKPVHIPDSALIVSPAIYVSTHGGVGDGISVERKKRQSHQRRRRRNASKSFAADEVYTFRRNRSRSRVPPRSKPCTRCTSRRNAQNQRCSRCM